MQSTWIAKSSKTPILCLIGSTLLLLVAPPHNLKSSIQQTSEREHHLRCVNPNVRLSYSELPFPFNVEQIFVKFGEFSIKFILIWLVRKEHFILRDVSGFSNLARFKSNPYLEIGFALQLPRGFTKQKLAWTQIQLGQHNQVSSRGSKGNNVGDTDPMPK